LGLPGIDVYDKISLEDQISTLRTAQQISQCHNTLWKPHIDLEEAYITSLPTNRLHFAFLEKKLSLSGGDIVFLSGSNGTGKSLFLNGLAGRLDGPMKGAIHCHKLRKIGYGNACFLASFRQEVDEGSGEDPSLLPPSDTTLCAMSRAGYICEESQAVGNINLGERTGYLTVGDILLRVNGLLQDSTNDSYALHGPNTPQIMMVYLYQVLEAVSLVDRLLFLQLSVSAGAPSSRDLLSRFKNDKQLSEEMYSHLCHTPLVGLSGGEQQRLRLAALFLIERIRYDVHRSILSSSVIPQLETQPMQLLLLDEPDHHIDSNFLLVLSLLLRTLHPSHQQHLILIVIMHQTILSNESLEKIFYDPPTNRPTEKLVSTLRYLRMRSCEDWTLNKTCDKAMEQYEILLKENQTKDIDRKITMSMSVLEEIQIQR
jgi:energy-coupling factor transporter ATP-binding protein EcfA2